MSIQVKWLGLQMSAGVGVHPDAVGRARDVVEGDALEDVGKRAVRDRTQVVAKRADMRREFLADHAEPKRRIRGVAVGGVFAEDGVGQRAVLLEPGEGEQRSA